MKTASLIKTVYNDVIICEVVKETETEVHIKHAGLLVPMENDRIGLAPYSPFTKTPNECNLKKTSIQHGPQDANEQISKLWNDVTNPSKLILPENSGKIII